MDVDDFRKAAGTLATRQGLALIRALRDGEWHIASDVAAHADVHISTATKHLAALHEAGILRRQETRAKTGTTYAYRLPSETVTLSLSLGEADEAGTAGDACRRFVAAAIQNAESLGWKGIGPRVVRLLKETFPDELAECPQGRWEDCMDTLLGDVENASPERLVGILRAIRAAFETALGPITSERVFLAALEELREDKLLESIPADLFYREEATA